MEKIFPLGGRGGCPAPATSVMGFQGFAVADPCCRGVLWRYFVAWAVALLSQTCTHTKDRPVICTLLFVKHLDEGTASRRYFYDANATFTWNGQL